MRPTRACGLIRNRTVLDSLSFAGGCPTDGATWVRAQPPSTLYLHCPLWLVLSPRKRRIVLPNVQTRKQRRRALPKVAQRRWQNQASSAGLLILRQGSLLPTLGVPGSLNQKDKHASLSQRGNSPSSSLSPISSCHPGREHPGNINSAWWLSKSSERSYTSGRWDFISQ